MLSPDDGAVLTQRGGVGGGGAAAMLPPAERAAAFMASPRNSLSRGMRPPGAVGGGVAGGAGSESIYGGTKSMYNGYDGTAKSLYDGYDGSPASNIRYIDHGLNQIVKY